MREKQNAKFDIQKVQPGLPGLMDGTVSTLAPIFATAGLPFLINNMHYSLHLAYAVVVCELLTIVFICYRFMEPTCSELFCR